MLKVILVHDEPRISQVIQATLRSYGVHISRVFAWEELERARNAASAASEMLIRPAGVGIGREGRCGN